MACNVIDQISGCLKSKQNFLLSGGAGSGKTFTLIQTLNEVYKHDKKARVACITYTNVAANEIKERSPYSKLWVSTIHDFLWDLIMDYQKNLKQSLISLIISEQAMPKTGISYSGEIEIDENTFDMVSYRNYRKIENGVISHDDLLKLAAHIFLEYPLMAKILCDKYDYIFIDEYQDTQRAVIDIFLEYIKKAAEGKLCLGFFGDKMQSIYETGIVDIQQYVDNGQVVEILKQDNYRCSQMVIALLNNIRSDISQSPAKKNDDGTIINKIGSTTFLYSNSDFDLAHFNASDYAKDWDIDDPNKTKLLFLTHRLIAKRAGWDGILSEYDKNDYLIGDDPDRLATHLLKLGAIIYGFKSKKYASVIGEFQRKIRTIQDKKEISNVLIQLTSNPAQNIGCAIDVLDEKKLLRKDDKFYEYIEEYTTRFNSIQQLSIQQVIAYYESYNNYSPYSTQHGVKGAEFENVLVVMDNGRWNNYNFKYLFEGTKDKESVILRTKRIFYVCCSRAMNNLVVYYPSPTQLVIQEAKRLFGVDNVKQL